ncbi:Clusterin-associated protein-1-domain-containing protein [Fimicolochytrium jonesii]|uniref:Clusterin-associated protein-1-domain-containing protein n=1 Tax=Fimicolochytrium jonesii TaxID=1396493 RepID=UPI0022FE0827|nr:Clusterin-associated protein-1-domain-containing protein [Fimicolochytrium jonesii]KAI8815595.1 Clusterin-associated protein-1-domain-containing protein [Fimicolochytrium jonesii]
MSYREMRSFTEKMRSLGYPKLISMESFRLPNFDMLADILLWLVKSYDPSAEVHEDVDTEQDRIIFIKSIAQLMAPKAHLRLNTRKLYMADGTAVRELLKIANVLYQAVVVKSGGGGDEDLGRVLPLDISSKVGQLKTCRVLATEITERGAKLYDSLGKEIELKDVRATVISRPFELKAMESTVTTSLTKLKEQISATAQALDNLAADEGSLVAKIEKKKVELERAQKRLASLQSVRPAYMDEYERIEKDLTKLYQTYMEKFRNLTFLEQQLDEYTRLEQDKFEQTEESLRQMQSRLHEEEMRLLRGEKELRGSLISSSLIGSDVRGSGSGGGGIGGRLARPKGASHRSQSFRTLDGTSSSVDLEFQNEEGASVSGSASPGEFQSNDGESDLDGDDDDEGRGLGGDEEEEDEEDESGDGEEDEGSFVFGEDEEGEEEGDDIDF